MIQYMLIIFFLYDYYSIRERTLKIKLRSIKDKIRFISRKIQNQERKNYREIKFLLIAFDDSIKMQKKLT
jgi:hypothetical protein